MRTWSFSSLNTYYTCPRQYELTYVNPVIPYTQTEATIWGTRVHEALELYIRDGVPLGPEYLQFKSYADKVLSLPGIVRCEGQFGVTQDYKPTSFDDKAAWNRGIIDVSVVNGNKALVLDWKTGKVRPDSDQLKLFAGVTFAKYPEVDTVKTAYIWLSHGRDTRETYRREQVPEIWRHFREKVRRLELSYEHNQWIPKPSGLCNGWCGAGKHCEYWKPFR